MQIRDPVRYGDWLRHRVAAARLGRQCANCPGTVIGTNPGKSGNVGEHNPPGLFEVRCSPNIGAVTLTRYEYDRGSAGAAALHIHLAAAVDVDQAVEIAVDGGVGGWHLNHNEKVCGQ